jgi:2-polyprenyl-3-methyl-5-hydroxy-6-metoxy-1,4-benzoquinol methylase
MMDMNKINKTVAVNRNAEPVEKHFDREYRQFDSFYREKKGIFSRIIDKIFRRSMQLRFEKVIKEVAPYEDADVFDVGCGTGRYSLVLALKGIKKALGIDFAQNMIDEANRLARQFKVDHICQFLKADFMQMNIDETFTHVFAMGVFDYIADPVPFVKKMVQSAKTKVMVSFPVPGGIIQGLRKFKFEKLKKCPVFFYSKEEVKQIARQAGAGRFTIDKMAKDYFLTIFLATEDTESTEER